MIMNEPWDVFPLAHPLVSCGLRMDLPKKQRMHHWVELGPDTRNCGSRGFADRMIFACSRCGRDVDKPLDVKITLCYEH